MSVKWQPVLVINLDTQETREFRTISDACVYLGCHWQTAKRMLKDSVYLGHSMKPLQHPTEKRCSKCGITKVYAEFGLGCSWCRDCVRENSRARYRRDNGLPADHPIQHKHALMKRCPMCGQVRQRKKDFYWFTNKQSGKRYPGGYCIPCQKKRHKEYHAATKARESAV